MKISKMKYVWVVRVALVAALLVVCVPAVNGRRAEAAGSTNQSPELDEAKRLAEQYRRLYEAGKYDEAIRMAERVLATYEKALGQDDALVAETLNNLAVMYLDKGDVVQAERLLQRSLTISRNGSGVDTTLLTNLALIAYRKGDYARAEALLQHILTVVEKTTKPDDPARAAVLNNLGEMYYRRADYPLAEMFFERALSILEKSPEVQVVNLAISLTNVGNVHASMQEYGRAESFYKRAIALLEKTYPGGHPDLAMPLANLANVYSLKGDYSRAEPLYRRALAVSEKMLGDNHPISGNIFADLSETYQARGELSKAVQARERANDIREHNLALVLFTGSQSEKLVYINSLSYETDATVTLHARAFPNDTPAARLALTTILRRKGRALDAWADQVGVLRRRLDPQDRALLDQLTSARTQLSGLVFSGQGGGSPTERLSALAELKADIERLENAISQRSQEFSVQAEPVTIERIQRMIPADAALVEIFSYRPYVLATKKEGWERGAPRYVAYVLRREGAPAWAELGEVAAVDRGVAEFRRALSTPQESGVKRAARSLDELVLHPVRRLLGDARHILLSPDGALNLIPFGALVDENDNYLVEGYTISYLTSGRDLLRLDAERAQRQPPLIIANPSFDVAVSTPAGQESPEGGAGSRNGLDFTSINVAALPGTAQEAVAIKNMMPSARILTERAATEAALKQVAGPRMLHVATHGFFLGSELPADNPTGRGPDEDPLLRSGLLLAGVTKGQSGAGEDGVLTALEAAGLDLWGTKLVVLSACDTGVGEVTKGDGVYGLRRALVLSGAESQLMSLWQVSDTATRDLMVDYYRRLEGGEGRAEALRAAQLALLREGGQTVGQADRKITMGGDPAGADRSHPFYWASFIPIGDWRPIGKATQPSGQAPRQTVAAAAAQPSAGMVPPNAAGPRPVPTTRGDVRQTRDVRNAAGASATDSFEAQVRAAAGSYKSGNLVEAASYLQRALALKPNDDGALRAMGDVKYDMGDYANAASFYLRSLAVRPDNAPARGDLGNTYFYQTTPNYDAAIAEYRKALSIDPKNERILQNLAAVALSKRSELLARDAINQLAEVNSSNPALAPLRAALASLRAGSNGHVTSAEFPRPAKMH